MKANCLTDKENMELRNKFCPEGSKLRESQMELFKMLLVLADICKEHKIQWWLSSGTLLGAARHQGFIPWDDDVDIVMMKEDYKRLEKVLMEMQSDEYVLQSLKTDVEYINVFAKFRRKTGQDLSIDRRRNFYRSRAYFRGCAFTCSWRGNGNYLPHLREILPFTFKETFNVGDLRISHRCSFYDEV